VPKILGFGYIPSFSGNVFLIDPYLSNKFFRLEDFKDLLSEPDCTKLKTYSSVYFRKKSFNDRDKTKFTFIAYCFNQFASYPSDIYFFYPRPDSNLKNIVSFKINIFNKYGFIGIETTFIDPEKIVLALGEDNASRLFLKEAFIDIRDIYFKHTHAVNDGSENGVPDSLTQASFNQNEDEAIKEIIEFHQRKIQEYNDFHIKLMIAHQKEKGNKKLMYLSAVIRRQAKGCFLYGMNFIIFNKNKLTEDDYELYIHLFTNALSGLDAFHEEAITYYSAQNSDLLKTLSLLSITIGSFIIGIGILNYSSTQGQNAYILGIFWILFVIIMIVVYITKDIEIKFSEFSGY